MSPCLNRLLCVLAFGILSISDAAGQNYPPQFENATTEVYKSVGNVDLNVWIFKPDGPSSEARPAIIFFFGGGWSAGTPAQFEGQAKRLAELGLVAVLADYRVSGRHQTFIEDAISDAQDAVRWIRTNATSIGVDPSRIAASGGSAGGHLAASTSTLSGISNSGADVQESGRPNALFLFNPVLVLAPIPGRFEGFTRFQSQTQLSMEDISPFHHLYPGMPPTWIFHGIDDALVQIEYVEIFCEQMTAYGDECSLSSYEDAGHGFFNTEPFYSMTLEAMIEGLQSLDWI